MSLSIVVPYRYREDHLKMFIPCMRGYLPDAEIIIVEQTDNKPFNRARLLNIGFLQTIATHFVFHDIDMIPFAVSYKERIGVTQLASSEIQLSDYLSGATMFSKGTFYLSEGYHNDYFHRAEDNEMMFNLKAKGIPVLNRHGIFKQLPHPRTGPEFIPELWQKAQEPRKINMLKNCKYELISKQLKDGYTLIKVLL